MAMHQFIRAAVLATAAFVSGVPAAAELTRVNDSGFVSRHAVVVEATPKEVWLALIAPATWWRAEHTWSGDSKNLTLTPQAGGCFCETIPEVDEPGRFTLQGSVEHMRVIQAYPEQALRMQGALGPLQSEPVMGVLTIVISKVDGGTQVVWEYNIGGTMRYEMPVIAKAVDAVMGVQLAALAKPLGPVTPTASEPKPAAPPQNAGAGVGSGEAAPGDPAAKPEVQLRKPSPASPSAKPTTAPAPSVPGAKSSPSAKPASVDDAFGDLEGEPEL